VQVDVLDALDEAFRHTHGVIAGVRAEQYGDKTPCTEWTVRELLEHMIGVVAGLGAAAAGEPRSPFQLGDDPSQQFELASATAMAAWRRPGVLDRVIDAGPGPMPGSALASINLLDTATHAWDLAAATGQPRELPPSVAAAAIAASQAIVTDELRAGRFAAEQPAPDGATATEQLVAFLGRTP
jgi:uncharacterized protein (TIGR03086 family)